MPVSFQETQNSPFEEFSRDGTATLVREFIVDWGDRLTFAGELLSGGSYSLPKQYPGLSGIRVDTVKIKPRIGKAGGGAFSNVETNLVTHDEALVTVTYTPGDPGTADPSLPSGTWAEYSIEESAEMLEIDPVALKWESDDEIVTANVRPTVLVPQTVHTVTWHSVTSPPWGHISLLKGKVNSNAWQIPSTGHYVYPETLMFMGATTQKTFDIDNTARTWSLTYRFWEKSIKAIGEGVGAVYDSASPSPTPEVYGWNHVWRPVSNASVPKWDKPLNLGNDDPLFQSDDFSDLFTLQASFN